MKHISFLGGLILLSSVVALVYDSQAQGQVKRRTGQPGVQRQEIGVDVLDDVTVRLKTPPPQFDDKGRPRKLTAEEKRSLKGPDPKLPGYTGDYSDLKPGQAVQVQLARLKSQSKKSGTDSASSDKKKQEYTVIGQLVARVSRLDNPRPAAPMPKAAKKKDDEKDKPEPGRKLYLRIESFAGIPVRQTTTSDGKQQTDLGDNVVISMIYIVEDPPKMQDQ